MIRQTSLNLLACPAEALAKAGSRSNRFVLTMNNNMSEEQQGAASNNPLVLVVEDDAFLRRMLTEKLSKDGLGVVEVTTGAEAHNILTSQVPNIILLDLMMPGTDGFQLLQEIKTNVATKDVPVIVLSNLGEKEYIERAMSLGAADYMVKAHFVLDEIVTKIRSLIK